MEEEDTDALPNSSEEGKSRFPFQVQTQIVQNPARCPVQKKIAKLGVSDPRTFNDVIIALKQEIESLDKRKSANAKIKIEIIKNKIDFLEMNRAYVRQLAVTFLSHQAYQFLQKKNLDFLYHAKKLSHLRNIKGLSRPTSVFFYPNQLQTKSIQPFGQTRPFEVKVRSSSNKLVMATLQFLFIDIDDAESWDWVAERIRSFGIQPDVMIQTSENSFHLYWSIKPVILDIEAEDKNGNQLDKKLILYEQSLKSLIVKFKADPKRSNASSLMRVPNTWNIKPHKNKKFHTKYLDGSRTLEEAKANPKFIFTELVSHISSSINPSLRDKSEAIYSSALSRPPELDGNPGPTETQVQSHIEAIKKKVEFDFTVGWENAFHSLCRHFNVDPKFFDSNDLIILKHMWTYRLVLFLTFPESIRSTLSGSGNKYSALKLSIGKIASLPRLIGHRKHDLIFLAESYKKPSKSERGKMNGYKVSPLFVEACGCKIAREKRDWLELISQRLYTKGNRNNGIPFDCFILHTVLQKTRDEASKFLVDKIERSASQSNESLRCSNDTSNVHAWLHYYYG